MKHLLLILSFVFLPLLAAAQSQEEQDKSYLTTLIEDNLSGASREVNIIGFAGALSSEATIARLTVADSEGIWLSLEEVTLIWNRSALLRGAIDVQEISATKIEVLRAPLTESTGPAPEATPFSLPELPVSISLGALDVGEIILGESFLGEPVSLSLRGTAELVGGQGTANVVAERLGEKSGVFEIDGRFDNDTKVLGLLLNLEEGPDGIAARTLDLPGRPAVSLNIEGTAPLDAYEATLAIATDGEDRLTGRFGLTTDEAGRLIRLDVGGDVSPLFDPAYQSFFGDDARLSVAARQTDDGRIDVSALDLTSQRLNLSGAVQIGAQGWPSLIKLDGGIAPDGTRILLPLSGPKTYVDGVDLSVDFDSAVSPDWRAELAIDGFDRPGVAIATLGLEGGGVLRDGEGDQIGLVTANFDFGAEGLVLDDPGATQAIGTAITGDFALQRTEGQAFELESLTVTGAGIDLQAQATVQGPGDGLRTQASVNMKVAALDRFSTLLGQTLGGGAELAFLATLTPLEGLFDIVLMGETEDLSVGIAEADAVLTGVGTISANAVRDADGTRIEGLRVQTDAALISGSADLTNEMTNARFEATLNEVALVLPDLSGPARLSGDVAINADRAAEFSVSGRAPAATLQVSGTANPTESGQTVNAAVAAQVTDLSRYARLAGRPLAGAADLTVTGVLLTDGLRFDLDVAGQTQDLAIGIDQLDPLLAGIGSISASVARPASESFLLSDLSITTPALSLAGDAAIRENDAVSADIDLRVADASLIDPALSGPLTASLKAAPGGGSDVAVDLRATGPSAVVTFAGTVSRPDFEMSGDLSAQVGSLAAYQRLIGQPVSGAVDLTVRGSMKPDLSAFDGTASLRSSNLQIGNPTADLLLRGAGRVDTTASLTNGTMQVRSFEATTPQLTIVASLDGRGTAGAGQFNASLRDVGILTDQISGPARASGTASRDPNGNWGINATGTGPGGLQAQVAGDVRQNGILDLRIGGTVPLALANAALEPRRISGNANLNLTVNGPPAIGSVGGRITVADGRLAAPTIAQALEQITGDVSLGGGTAQVNLRANVEAGGNLAVTGPIGLTAPFPADITATLRRIRLLDRALYDSTLNGTINLNGPIQNGARVIGRLNLGETNIRVPSSTVGTLGDLPEVLHLGQTAAVQQTLDRAGINAPDQSGTTAQNSAGPAFPLDIRIDAPSRIFIRGRGLDAELGGQLTIGGTSKNVIPVGRFDLLRGRIDILQQRFDLTEGSASLQGGFTPYIRLVATTESTTGTTINIVVEGPAGEPEVRFESIPELPQDEVLSQLIFGRDLSSISPLQAVQLASAISTLAGRGGGAVDRLRRNLGLDDFDVTTDEEGATAFRAGKYLSDNVYTDVTVTSEGDTEINLNLDITDEITAKSRVNQDGETGIGIFFERDY